ncbi:hypothetical protein ITX44_37205 [Streptomyces sp. KK5PA1]|uniref:GNAT family N-acetyltransferase n=2 Tax=Actinacidiphila acididurans TaxID=2784346 RepID=A0ABS2U436_9ACTN|nr:hypothetical protein [Actinacidiphila acididurans]
MGGNGWIHTGPYRPDPAAAWGPFMRSLTREEIRAWCPGGRPTEAEWHDALRSDRLDFPDRAAGNCVVLHVDGQPAAIGYWGVTAD